MLAVVLSGSMLVSHAADDADSAANDDNGVFLPADRVKERQLDRARRLIAGDGWTDAAALIDELLADDRDAFVL